ncbi:MAG TPA: neprosin family prolyl endopeptidase [Polyangia bacterium]|nr:neprosin family prolyl endopeptidase [Polyangia bacterium]
MSDKPQMIPRDPQTEKEIREFFAEQRKLRKVVATTRTRSGQELDWVPIESQLPGGVPAPPPPHAAGVAHPGATLTRFELDEQPEARGPAGTVPILRYDTGRAYSARGMRGLLAKNPPPLRDGGFAGAPGAPTATQTKAYCTAATNQRPNYGCQGTLNIWSPYVGYSDNLSLSQIAEGGGAGANFQGVEAGWLVYGDVNGDWSPHLFTYFTTCGYTQSGDYLGGYNRAVGGWVQISPSIFPGAALTPSTPNGPQAEIVLRYTLRNGGWWLSVNGSWIGYYPTGLFNAAGIAVSAASHSFYGEVGDAHDPPGTPGLQMGSGVNPALHDASVCCYQRNLLSQLQPDTWNLANFLPDWTDQTNPYCYRLVPHYLDTGAWGSYCYLGGPGMVVTAQQAAG